MKTSGESSSVVPKYEPTVGDVVEFEYRGTTCKGLIYLDSDFSIMPELENGYWCSSGASFHEAENLLKVGHTDTIPEGRLEFYEAWDIAKAYFDDRPYAERQAEWVADNNIKVGSMVKVVRAFKDYENGFGAVYGSAKLDLGKTLTVSLLESYDETLSMIKLDSCNCHPYFVLEPVS